MGYITENALKSALVLSDLLALNWAKARLSSPAIQVSARAAAQTQPPETRRSTISSSRTPGHR